MEDKTKNGRGVSESSFFSLFLKKAENYMKTPGRVTSLLNDAYQKASKQKDASEVISEVWDALQELFRMIKAAVSGEYTGIPGKTVVGGIAVLIYFLSPIDVVPDFIPIVGLLDDMSLMAWFMTSIKDELDKFRSWEISQRSSQKIGNTNMTSQNANAGSPIKDHGTQGGLAMPGAATQGHTAAKASTGADYPGSAGEMRKDVAGEAKANTAGSSNTMKSATTGNLAADESHGTGKNLGDSSRTPKTDNNPYKDGAHNR